MHTGLAGMLRWLRRLRSVSVGKAVGTMSVGKRVIFYLIMLSVPVLVPVVAVWSYYGYQKVSAPATNEGSYGQIDGELGWILKPGSRSRYYMTDRVTGAAYFDSTVYTNAAGFRAPRPDAAAAAPGGVLAIGDSWTFGYAVDYDESYPAQLERLLGRDVVNMGVPAYGSAQVLLLLERHIEQLRPTHVIHLNLGLWNRSLCHGDTRPQHILKPCFWWNSDPGEVELVAPREGYVEGFAAKGVLPGGWLTAGNDSWAYYLVSRPAAKLKQSLTAAGLMPGHRSEYDADPILGQRALEFTLDRLAELAARHDFTLVLVDPPGDYAAARDKLAGALGPQLAYISPADWAEEVDRPASALVPADRTIPKDGHYGPGMNRLIAEVVARRMAAE